MPRTFNLRLATPSSSNTFAQTRFSIVCSSTFTSRWRTFAAVVEAAPNPHVEGDVVEVPWLDGLEAGPALAALA